jgi:hypothetical protein
MKQTPPGVYKQKDRYRSQCSIYHNRKAKFVPFSCGTFETEAQAIHAREIIIKLVGLTPESKRKVRPYLVRALVNEYRESLGLKLLKTRDK